jgi:uroporphyrinogen decarboxylase
MQADLLKREFGDRLTFWGGVDTHAGMDAADAAGASDAADATDAPQLHRRIEDEVKHVIDIMAQSGGYVLSAIHNIQPNISAQDICALFETALDYGSP